MSVPNAFETPNFETLLSDYIAYVLEYVSAKNPELTPLIADALNNESELLAQVVQALVLKRIAEKREDNHQALQMFRKFVSESEMVDLLALQYNLKRQILKKADTSIFPPVPAVMEADKDLLRRFDMAPYQFHCTGTRAGYKFHAMTLGERPFVRIESTEGGLAMHFDFPKEAQPNLVKDANARMLKPSSGKVCVAVLSRESLEGVASDDLLSRMLEYLNRDDIAQESDELSVKSALIKPFRIHAILFTGGDPNHDITQLNAITHAQDFANSSHRLEGRIDQLKLGEIFYGLNPVRVELIEPASDVVCAWDEAPFCTEILIDVRAE